MKKINNGININNNNYYNNKIQTDRTIQANRPDIVVKDLLGNVCYLIDMSVPSDKNVSSKTFEKLSKYKDLEIEIGKMWHLRARNIPVVIGALGLVKKGTKGFLDKIPGQSFFQRNPEDSSKRHSPYPQKSSINITSNFTHLRSLVVTRCLIL